MWESEKRERREERELRKARGGGWMDVERALKGLVVTGKCDRQLDEKLHPPRK